jgi:hypothetical protein
MLDYSCSPFVGAKVTRMAREKPVMSVQVDNAVLQFAIDGLVEIFHNRGASRFRSLEMCVYILDKHGKALRSVAKICGHRRTCRRSLQHYPGVTKVHLRAADQAVTTVVVMLAESEDSCEPYHRFRDIAIQDVRQHSVGRHGTILRHESTFGR